MGATANIDTGGWAASSGAAASTPKANRINIPALLLGHAGIQLPADNEIIVSGLGEKIELWSKARYDKSVLDDAEDFDFGTLAEEVRQDLEPNNEN